VTLFLKDMNDVIAEKETIEKKHTFIMNEDLPHDDPDNQFEISWDEDTITSIQGT
jgi:hypothetical protein